MKGTNWKFVQTGSGSSTAHADLGRMTSSVMDAPRTSPETAMPLVAPAMKAVAQTALRKSRGEQAAGSETSSAASSATNKANGPDNTGQSASGEPVLSKEAFEALAVKMADRVARRMKREQERRGQWR